jgi:RNA polymerase sigma factor (sigma-70 family)
VCVARHSRGRRTGREHSALSHTSRSTYDAPADGVKRPSAVKRRTGTRPPLSESQAISAEYLLHRVARGDPGAVQETIARFGGLIWSLARRLGMPDADAEDAVNEIFTEIWRNGAKYDASIASETAFVATIARRRLIDRRRRMNRQADRVQISEDVAAAPRPESDTGEEARRAAKALTALSPDQQRVLRLSVYEGLSHELIARATGLPLGTVKTHARRGLIRLREMMTGGDAEGAAS